MADSITQTTSTRPTDIHTTINFHLDPSQGGQNWFVPGTYGSARRSFDKKPVQIHDIRGQGSDFSLAKQGFQFVLHDFSEKGWYEDDKIKGVPYSENNDFLKKITGATKVYTFSHIVRRGDRKTIAEKAKDPSVPDDETVGPTVPAQFAHVDQSEVGARCVLSDHFSEDEVETLSKTRWGIINSWRPLKPITHDPLGVCDARSISDDYLVPVDATFNKQEGGFKNVTKAKVMQTLAAKSSSGQKWHYASHMVPGEVLLIKCFDSIDDGETARRAPHSAFIDPDNADFVEPRESVEMRALVFWEDQEP